MNTSVKIQNWKIVSVATSDTECTAWTDYILNGGGWTVNINEHEINATSMKDLSSFYYKDGKSIFINPNGNQKITNVDFDGNGILILSAENFKYSFVTLRTKKLDDFLTGHKLDHFMSHRTLNGYSFPFRSQWSNSSSVSVEFVSDGKVIVTDVQEEKRRKTGTVTFENATWAVERKRKTNKNGIFDTYTLHLGKDTSLYDINLPKNIEKLFPES